MDAFGRHLQHTVYREVGIPVGVGISTTKSLTKLANWASKKWKKKTGAVSDLINSEKQEKLLRFADVGEVWGVGRQLTKHLNEMGVRKAWDLASFDKKTIRKAFNVNLEKTARELAGEPCYELEEHAAPKQMIACTRSFSERINTIEELRAAVATVVSNAAIKLRAQNCFASCVQVFVQTSPFDNKGQQYGRSISVPLTSPSYDTRDLIAAAQSGLQQIFKDGPRYAKAGVILSQFFEPGMFSDDLFAKPARKNTSELMSVLDKINMMHGRGSVRFAVEPAAASWHMKQKMLSQNFTTRWSDVMEVNA